jgi:hypothetical protein
MTFKIRPFTADEAQLLYSNNEKDKELGCVGHLRGDFGYKGKEFWHTWFDHQAELNTQEFKADIAAVIDKLRAEGPLKNLISMDKYCNERPELKIPGALHPDTYGFCVESKKFLYFLRCFPQHGEYNFYVFCYKSQNQRILEKTDSSKLQTCSQKKKQEPER